MGERIIYSFIHTFKFLQQYWGNSYCVQDSGIGSKQDKEGTCPYEFYVLERRQPMNEIISDSNKCNKENKVGWKLVEERQETLENWEINKEESSSQINMMPKTSIKKFLSVWHICGFWCGWQNEGRP